MLLIDHLSSFLVNKVYIIALIDLLCISFMQGTIVAVTLMNKSLEKER